MVRQNAQTGIRVKKRFGTTDLEDSENIRKKPGTVKIKAKYLSVRLNRKTLDETVGNK